MHRINSVTVLWPSQKRHTKAAVRWIHDWQPDFDLILLGYFPRAAQSARRQSAKQRRAPGVMLPSHKTTRPAQAAAGKTAKRPCPFFQFFG
jgi:hypothetical protein